MYGLTVTIAIIFVVVLYSLTMVVMYDDNETLVTSIVLTALVILAIASVAALWIIGS